MKIFFLFLLFLFLEHYKGNSLNAQSHKTSLPNQKGKGPILRLERDTLIIDTITDTSTEYKGGDLFLKVYNDGDEPLIIYYVRSTDPSFATDWTKEPIFPGKYGIIRWVIAPKYAKWTQVNFIDSNDKTSPSTPFFLKRVPKKTN